MVDIDVIFSIVVTVLTGIATIMNAIASKLSQEAGDRASLIIVARTTVSRKKKIPRVIVHKKTVENLTVFEHCLSYTNNVL